MPELNVPMLRKYVEWVEEQDKLPEWKKEWNQGNWMKDKSALFDYLLQYTYRAKDMGLTKEDLTHYRDPEFCGTAYCVAGKVAADAGYQLDSGGEILGLGKDLEPDEWFEHPCADYAADALGLTERQANALFDGSNDAADIREYVETWIGEKL